MKISNSATINCANPVNWTHPLARGLVAWYLCVPGLTGGAKWHNIAALPSDLRRGNHGILTGIVPSATSGFAPTNRRGGFGEMRLDGTDDYTDLGNNSTPLLPATADWSISGWMLSTQLREEVLFGQYIATGENGRLLIRRSDSDTTKIALFLGDQGTHPSVNLEGGTILTTSWNHVVATRSGAVFNLYLNGMLSATRTDADSSRAIVQAGTLFGARTSEIFTYNSAPLVGYLTGGIDSIAIFNRAISLAEVVDWRNLSLTGYPGLLARIRVPPPLNLSNVTAPDIPGAEYAAVGPRIHFAVPENSRCHYRAVGPRVQYVAEEE